MLRCVRVWAVAVAVSVVAVGCGYFGTNQATVLATGKGVDCSTTAPNLDSTCPKPPFTAEETMLPPSRTLASGMVPEILSGSGRPRARILQRPPSMPGVLTDLEEDWGEHTHRTIVSIRIQDYGNAPAAQAAETRLVAQITGSQAPQGGAAYRVLSATTVQLQALGQVAEIVEYHAKTSLRLTDRLLARGRYVYLLTGQQMAGRDGSAAPPVVDPVPSLDELLANVGTRPVVS